MSSEEGPDSIDGLELADAVDAVVAADDSRDPAEVRRALDHVAEDGVVIEAAVESAFAHLSKVVSTPETRVEFTRMELSEAKERAEPVDHLDVVAARLDDFEARVQQVETQVAALGGKLQDCIDRHGAHGDLYETAVGIHQLTDEANSLQAAADDLQLDLERFGSWVETESVRLTELEEDVAAAEDELDELEAAVDQLEATMNDVETPAEIDGLAVGWVQTSVGRRISDVLLADVCAELAALREWPGGVTDRDRFAAIEADLDDLEARNEATAERLDDLATPAWREQFGGRLDDLDVALETFEPPVDWGKLQATVEDHRIDGAE